MVVANLNETDPAPAEQPTEPVIPDDIVAQWNVAVVASLVYTPEEAVDIAQTGILPEIEK